MRGVELERGMVATLRLRRIVIGAAVTESLRRVVLSMPTSPPWKDLLMTAASRIAALA
jgi:hypothetical protein